MDNFNLSRTLVENINNQNDKINNCIDIVNGLAKDEEIKVIQELRINEELRQQNELIRQQNELERQQNELSRIETVNKQLETMLQNNNVQYNEVFNKYPKPFFVAHRGVSELYPENSIPGFEETSKYDKCIGIETDVMLTADNKWVCM